MLLARNSQVFTASGTFTVPASVYCIYASGTGAGSAGASAYDSTHAGANNSGGGSGAYCLKVPIPVVPEEEVEIIIGVGGTPGFGPPYTTTWSYRVYGEPILPNYIGYPGIYGTSTRIKNVVLDAGQPAFWSISFAHPWSGSGGGNGTSGWEVGIPGAIAGEIIPGREGLAAVAGKGSNRFFGGSSGGAFGGGAGANGLRGGGSPGRLIGGAPGNGWPFDGSNQGTGGSGGGGSLWGRGGNGGVSDNSTSSFTHNPLMDGEEPEATAYGAGGAGGAAYDSAYGLGAPGRPGYVMISW